MKHCTRSFLLIVLFALVGLNSTRAQVETTSQKFSDPSKPGKLRVLIGHGDLRVHGTDTDQVTVKTDAKPNNTVRKDGLRVLTASANFSLSERDNLIVLDSGTSGWKGNGSDFDVTVPRGTSLIVPSATGGDIFVADVSGDVEVKSFNGEVKLENLSGGVQVETMNGQIRASFARLAENKPLSFVSMNGEIIVRVPATTKANVRLRTQNGTILTDFDDKVLVSTTESIAATRGVRVRISKSTSGDTSDLKEAAREAAQAARDAAAMADRAVRAAVAEVRASTSGSADGTSAPMSAMPPLPPMTGGKLVSGTLNGGGPEILLTAMNGDVVLRKYEAAK